MNEQQLAECVSRDEQQRAQFPVGTRVHVREHLFTRNIRPLRGDLRPCPLEPVETATGWELRPSGGMASVPDVYEVDQVVPGYPLDCGSSEGPGYWHARFTVRNLSRPDGPWGPVTVPAVQLVLVDDVPALPADDADDETLLKLFELTG